MKAFRFYEHGGTDVLRLEDVAIGEPQRGELRIRNTAVAVNFRDVLVRRGTHAVKAFPSGIGLESAGVGGSQDVAGHAFLVLGDEGVLRLEGRVGGGEDLADDAGVRIEVGGVRAAVAGLQADVVQRVEVARSIGADLRHLSGSAARRAARRS